MGRNARMKSNKMFFAIVQVDWHTMVIVHANHEVILILNPLSIHLPLHYKRVRKTVNWSASIHRDDQMPFVLEIARFLFGRSISAALRHLLIK